MKKSINEYNLIKYLKFLLKEENKKKRKALILQKLKKIKELF